MSQDISPSNPSKPLKIAIAGLGTIGSGVYQVINSHRDNGHALEVASIIEINTEGPFAKPIHDQAPELFTNDLDAVLADAEITVVVETVGGRGFAKTLIEKSLAAGKHVVTANKDLIATNGKELQAIAEANGVRLICEAAVAGAIPIIRLMENYFHGEDIERVVGILNGTTNYILSQMDSAKISFAEALSAAQGLGFAEADPTNDVKGYDARYKLVILTYLVTGHWIEVERIQVEGIDGLDLPDFEYAERLGRKIKLIACLKRDQGKIAAFVMPLMIDEHDPVAMVAGGTNIVTVSGKFSEDISLIGPGAGSLPTASAIVADIQLAASGQKAVVPAKSTDSVELIPFADLEFRHTLRFEVNDQPGIIGSIGTILAENGISIYAIEQLPQYQSGEDSGTAIFTATLDRCREGTIQSALDKINKESYIAKPTAILREL